MPAGDLVTQDYHLELRGLLMGPGTRFHFDGPWSGLGLPTPKTADVDLEQGEGSYPGRDYLASRVLTFPIGFGGSSAAEAMLDLLALSEAWQVSNATDLVLVAQLPGWEKWSVTGRPRGLVEDLTRLKSGEGRALATFVANDPTITFLGAEGSGS